MDRTEFLQTGIWKPPLTWREMRAVRRREIAKGVCFIVLITAVLGGLLWGLP